LSAIFPQGPLRISDVSRVVATGKPKSQETVKQPPGEVEEDQCQDALFSCSNVGCIKVYQHRCSLENHLSYGKCGFLPVRETLIPGVGGGRYSLILGIWIWVWFLSRFGLKTGIDFEHFGLKLGMVIGGTFTKAYKLIFLPRNRGE